MQIKEVAARSALTERAVRLYEERGLINPHIENKNGRDFRDYSERDLERLKIISALRRALFTVDEIKEMLDAPSKIEGIIELNRQRVSDDASQLSYLRSRLDVAASTHITSAGELSRVLFAIDGEDSQSLELPADAEDYAGQYHRIYDKYFSENTGWDRRYDASLRVGGVLGTVRRIFSRRIVLAVIVCVLILAAVMFTVLNFTYTEKIHYKYEGGISSLTYGEKGKLEPGIEDYREIKIALNGKIEHNVQYNSKLSGEVYIDGFERIVNNHRDGGVISVRHMYFDPDDEPPYGKLYRSNNLTAVCDEDGNKYVCEMFTTSQLEEIVILLYPLTDDPPADEINSYDTYQIWTDQIKTYYFRMDENTLSIAVRRSEERFLLDQLFTRARNAKNDELYYIYTNGIYVD